ncbi:MAG: maleylpyruvate isomerase N-terminal domain-containing protein [Anaerolineales bacterium]
MSELSRQLATSLESEGRKTLGFFGGLAQQHWDLQVYADGPAWKVHDLLAHLTEVEGSIPRLVRSILQGGQGVKEAFDIDVWNAEHTAVLSRQDNQSLLVEFASRRVATVELVRGLSDQDLEKRGRHPALGMTEVKHMLRLMYIHVQGHQRDIRRVLQAQAG